MTLELGVLDYASVDAGSTPEQAVAETRQLAQRAEQLDYQHFWLAEHHGHDSGATTAPEMLMAHVASVTERIGVGSGGVLLPNYSAYKVAEQFLTMSAFAPGRIHLGLGRATGADGPVTIALNDEKEIQFPYEKKLVDLLGFLGADHPEGSRYTGMQARPRTSRRPTPWVLSASGSNARLAGENGIGFTFAHFINPSGKGPKAAQWYREAFQPSIFLDRPQVIAAVFVAVADDRERAELLAKAFQLRLVDPEAQNPSSVLRSLDEVAQIELSPQQKAAAEQNRGRILVGTGEEVYDQLEQLAADYGTDKIMVNLYFPGAENRIRALELLAEERDRRAAR